MAWRTKASLVVAEGPDALASQLAELSNLGVDEVVLIVPVRTRAMEEDLSLWAGAAGLRAAA